MNGLLKALSGILPHFSVYIATSLDGFIARPDGNIDWLMAASAPDDPNDYGYADFMNSVDVLVMGRNSFEKVLTFGAWPYEKRVIVMSRLLEAIPADLDGKVDLFSGTPQELAAKLQSEGVKKVYVDGGKLIQSFLREGLIRDMIITQIPILIGDGIPLFGPLAEDVKLTLVEAKGYASGFVQVKYEIKDHRPQTSDVRDE